MADKYKTFAEQFYLEEAGFIRRLKRDIRLLYYIFATLVRWARAWKVRAEFKRCRKTGQPFYVDRFTPSDIKK